MSQKLPSALCIICARGGSKGIPNKNIREIGGKPLIAHTIEDAQDWDVPSDLIVSTDNPEIASVAEEYGAEVPFQRPPEMATDDAPKLPAIQHAVTTVEEQRGRQYDIVIDLDPTVPLRAVTDINDAFNIVRQDNVENVQTVVESERNPYYNMLEMDEKGYARLSKQPTERIVRRQDAPPVYAIVGSVAAYERELLRDAQTILDGQLKVNEVHPERGFPIDRPLDMAIVETILEGDF